MKDFDKVLYEGTVLAVGKILSKYNVFAQGMIMRDMGSELVKYLGRHGFWFEEDGSLQDLNRTVELFLSQGFAENLKVESAEHGDNYIWKGLYLLSAYKELQDATGNPFISCPMNLCLSHLCDERGKYFKLHDKTFDMENQITVSNWELVDRQSVDTSGFDPLVIENARLYEIAEERADRLQKAQDELKEYAIELEKAKNEAEAHAKALEKKAEELAAARKEADAAAAVRARFLADMSHEIRTPMNGVIGLASLLSESDLSSSQRELVDIINSSGTTLLGIINDVLDLSKIEAGKMVINEGIFNLVDLANKVKHVFEMQAKSRNLNFECVISPAIPLSVIGDHKRIEQVLYNLVGNAMKFTHSGSVRMELERCEGSNHIDEYQITISDTGIGIDQELVKVLFDPFSQGKLAESRQIVGTGLGLCICKQLVEAMGGCLTVESELGKGSTFKFNLVLREGNQLLENEVEQELDIAEIIPDLKVLLAEDNLINQRTTQLILDKTDCLLSIVPNGEEAVLRHQKEPFDIILMDNKMPVLGGLEATRRIRKWESTLNLPRVPIIAITANAMEGDLQKCLEAGMDDYLAKPINPELLIRAIGRWQNRSETDY